MDVYQETVTEFVVGHGGADATSKPIVAAGYARKAYKGVRVRAATANAVAIYVGPQGVTEETGYPLPAGEEVAIQIENPSKVHVTAVPAGNSQQVVTLSGEIAGDTFALTLNGETTGPLAVSATAGTVQTALQALIAIGAGNCTVTGSEGGPYTVEFLGDLEKIDVNLMVGTGSGVNETQTVAIDDASSAGTFTLTLDGQTTAPINHNATAGDVEDALELLANIGAGNVGVTGGPGPTADWAVEFKGTLGLIDVPAMTGDGSLLTGGSTTVTITETQKGDATCTVTVTKTDASAGSQYSWIAV